MNAEEPLQSLHAALQRGLSLIERVRGCFNDSYIYMYMYSCGEVSDFNHVHVHVHVDWIRLDHHVRLGLGSEFLAFAARSCLLSPDIHRHTDILSLIDN
jgi:hypothetical protein